MRRVLCNNNVEVKREWRCCGGSSLTWPRSRRKCRRLRRCSRWACSASALAAGSTCHRCVCARVCVRACVRVRACVCMRERDANEYSSHELLARAKHFETATHRPTFTPTSVCPTCMTSVVHHPPRLQHRRPYDRHSSSSSSTTQHTSVRVHASKPTKQTPLTLARLGPCPHSEDSPQCPSKSDAWYLVGCSSARECARRERPAQTRRPPRVWPAPPIDRHVIHERGPCRAEAIGSQRSVWYHLGLSSSVK